jgi:thiaminase/transcriptional activator TenA
MGGFDKSALAVGAGDLWAEATQAQFLDALGAGTLPEDAFHRWLVQDYLFAQGLTSFQAVATAKTPREAQRPLIAGLSALDAEMEWFEQNLTQRGLNLRAEHHPVCRRYVDFLISAAYSRPFEVLLAILYGVEVSYLAAWSRLPAEGPYAEFIQRRSNEGFVGYVRSLLELCARHPHADQQKCFDEVLRHEADFWRMTWGD